MSDETKETPGLSRRTVLKRGAIVGGTLVWATPVVQTIASNQFALAGSAGCSVTLLRQVNGGQVVDYLYTSTDATCCGGLSSKVTAYDAATAYLVLHPNDTTAIANQIEAYNAISTFVLTSDCASKFSGSPVAL